MMTQQIFTQFTIRGPNWSMNVPLDPSIYDTEAQLFIEAATCGIDAKFRASRENFQLGPIVSVKRKSDGKEAMVNAYTCLINSGHHKMAERLRENFKSETEQDLRLDDSGISW